MDIAGTSALVTGGAALAAGPKGAAQRFYRSRED
jgi:hypothetical protein